jgi:hypothetical protein
MSVEDLRWPLRPRLDAAYVRFALVLFGGVVLGSVAW